MDICFSGAIGLRDTAAFAIIVAGTWVDAWATAARFGVLVVASCFMGAFGRAGFGAGVDICAEIFIEELFLTSEGFLEVTVLGALFTTAALFLLEVFAGIDAFDGTFAVATFFGEAFFNAVLSEGFFLATRLVLVAIIFLEGSFLATLFSLNAFFATTFFKATFLGAIFLTAVFLETTFFGEVFLGEIFFTIGFFGAGFLAIVVFDTTFFRVLFFGTTFLTVIFFAVVFFAGAFFLAATFLLFIRKTSRN
ncbi:MAG: hypothetical protein ACLPN1_18705 [Dissulfurispiraceae bacterium]